MATITEKWDSLDADLREALVKWYNLGCDEDDGETGNDGVIYGLDDDDREALLGLVEAGRFWFWDCPVCDEHCTHGDPENWEKFQGVNNQDYQSLPGDPDIFTEEARIALCDKCRRTAFGMPEEGEYPPVDACLN